MTRITAKLPAARRLASPRLFALFVLALSASAAMPAAAPPIVLDPNAIENLGIQTVEAQPADFAETVFAIGRMEPIPARKSVLSSRVPGRVVEMRAYEGDIVEAGQTIVVIESLQPGNPPPRIELSAPQQGMVMRSHTHLGKPVVPDQELFEIVDLSELYAVARLPEDQAGRTRIGTRASIRVPAQPDRAFEGELHRYGTEANAASGTIDALFRIENPDRRLRPSMRAEFSIVLNTRENTMAVPKLSVQSDGLSSFVFVKDYDLDNAFVKAPVVTGSRNETLVEVVRGLFPGDQVVTNGAYALMFAGGGTISLKEALDAAHGHEHNEDGSEITAAEKSQSSQSNADGDASGGDSGPAVLFLSLLSGLLFVLLILSLTLRRKPAANA